ncbi:hypothetical protein IE53DRAFT_201713 [Violaceomyces palustris]|uniref:Uncharacterized protein n=1 Tax=Violaceomyces palustris TaxID=1673888 RepID=A0ACD0P574_9BASI|nr:hypothetical protein IE53DRAFT_201713 [Violaceomyces palustris]
MHAHTLTHTLSIHKHTLTHARTPHSRVPRLEPAVHASRARGLRSPTQHPQRNHKHTHTHTHTHTHAPHQHGIVNLRLSLELEGRRHIPFALSPLRHA